VIPDSHSAARRRALHLIGAWTAFAAVAPRSFAQPSGKPLRIIVPFPAGGGTDVLARIVAERLRGPLGTVIVDNRVGASGRIGVEAVKNAEADGSTLLFTPDFLLTVFPHSFRSLSYNPLADFAPVAIVARSALTLSVGPALPAQARTVAQYLDWAKQNEKQAFFATTSPGGTPHFIGVMLARASGVALSPVHYKGGAPALQDLLGGQIPVSVNPIGEVLPYVKSGRIRVLATTGAARSRYLPEVPTFAESGFRDIVAEAWLGFLAPGRTPAQTVARLAAVIGEAAKAPETMDSLEKSAMEGASSTPESFAATLRADLEKWGPIVKASGFTAED
jgi:tripartite-type tricarboxylate transporter receptor subunit TctC